MSFITVGNALGCTINSHRRGWDGSICKNAETWNCSAKQQFRTDYCQQGDPRCYHIHIFEEANPYCLIDDLGIGWLLEPYPDALNNQILLFWGKRFQEPRGISDINMRPKDYVFGAYRVKSVSPQKINEFKTLWKIEPYLDGWTRFQQPYILTVYYKSIIGGVYLKEVNRVAVENMFEKAAEQASSPHPNWTMPQDAERFENFHAHLQEWFELAREDALKIQQTMVHTYSVNRSPTAVIPLRGPFEGLKNLDIKKPITTTVITTHKPIKNGTLSPTYPIIEKEATKEKIKTIYSKEVLDAVMAASFTKNILILTGSPGVGKSSLAIDLIDDYERKLIVSVGSTWRGREDLLGYVNPISNEFEPTDFTKFLCKAETAWRKNDKRTYVVIFEEFNLSQPEYWFADILVRSQYPEEQEKLRMIELGGKSIRGVSNNTSKVLISPALRFIATINNDHTTLSLSPRVLDRTSIVELSLEPRTTLDRAKLDLEEKQIMSIEELDALLKYKNAMFSLRAAESLKRCLDNMQTLDMNSTWDALDIVLIQQVLTKVRLMVGDPGNDSLMQGLEEWTENYGKYLRRCANLVNSWTEALKDGRDIIQA
ncbi:ATPase AAA [Thioploca ingrica]|uniref:ATPase AAA n=1 Tax=Thioploca ingrica TaxID=40754 RepID=A0A090BUJ1_9GAMM|nr:ATPase AAA [Thioploca ingrica]